jgi:hypothetical protein
MRVPDVVRLLHEHLQITIVLSYGGHLRTPSDVRSSVRGKHCAGGSDLVVFW